MSKIKTINEYIKSSNYIKPVICILGAEGQLGHEFINYLSEIDYKHFIGFDRSLDITNKDHIKHLKAVPCEDYRYPDIIINCSAYNKVYESENNEEEKIICFKTNALGPKYLAEFCKENNIKLVHFSTNYVFEDSRYTMKSYSEFDSIKPFLFYGFSKFCGEKFIKECISDNSIIIRTAWLFSRKGPLIRLIKEHEKLGEVMQIAAAMGNPTYTLDLVKQTLNLINHNANGLYHCVNTGTVAKKQYIDKIINLMGSNVETKATFPGPSISLNNFMLKMEELNIMRPWEEAVEDCFKIN